MNRPNLKVAETPKRCGDAPAMLRKLADELEADPTAPAVICVITGPNGIALRGFGELDGMIAIASLHLARVQLANKTLGATNE